MSYIEAEGTLLGANMKKGGKLVLQIEISEDLDNKEDYFHLRKMIEKNVRFSLESTIVSYKVEINAKTNKPIREYKVDETGVVSEVSKPEGEQLEAELGLPKENVPVKEERAEADQQVIDDFIRSGLAPIYEDMTYDFPHIFSRINDGVTYSKIAYELNISLGEFSVIMDEYRHRVAPLAIKWDEWRQGKSEGEVVTPESGQVPDEGAPEATEGVNEPAKADPSNEYDECQQGADNNAPLSEQTEVEPEDIEGYILKNRPKFEEITFDFPALLERRKNGETWMEIAQSIKIPSTKLQSDYSKYRKRVAEIMKDGAA